METCPAANLGLLVFFFFFAVAEVFGTDVDRVVRNGRRRSGTRGTAARTAVKTWEGGKKGRRGRKEGDTASTPRYRD